MVSRESAVVSLPGTTVRRKGGHITAGKRLQYRYRLPIRRKRCFLVKGIIPEIEVDSSSNEDGKSNGRSLLRSH